MQVKRSINRRQRLAFCMAATMANGLLLSRAASAAGPFTYTWTGAGDGVSWGSAANWSSDPSGGTVPSTLDTVDLNDTGGVNRTIVSTNTSTYTIANLNFTQTSPSVNLLDIRQTTSGTFNVSNNIILGATGGGTSQIFVDPNAATGTPTNTFQVPTLTLDPGGVMELSTWQNSAGATMKTGLTGNLIINGGTFYADDSVTLSSVPANNNNATTLGSLNMTSGVFSIGAHQASSGSAITAKNASGGVLVFNTGDRMTVNGNFQISGGTFTSGGTVPVSGVGSEQLFLTGAINTIHGLSAASTAVTPQITIGGNNAELLSDDSLTGGFYLQNKSTVSPLNDTLTVGLFTPSPTGAALTVGSIGLSTKVANGSEGLLLTSNITTAIPLSNAATSSAAGATFIVNTNGFTLNMNIGNAMFRTGAGFPATESWVLNNSAGAASVGTIDAGAFDLSGPTGTNPVTGVAGTNVGSYVNLVATAQLSNNLNNAAGSIDPNSTFTLSLSGGNTINAFLGSSRSIGNLNVNVGILELSSNIATGFNASTGYNSLTTVNSGATLDLEGNTLTAGNITGAGIVENNKSGGTATLTIGNNNASGGSFAGVLVDHSGSSTGILALSKIGTGTIALSGTSTFSGGTTVNAGSLVARNTKALGTGNVSVASGANLSYYPIAAGPLNISGGLTITGGAGTVLGGALGAALTTDQINVTGAAAVTGAVQVNIYGTNTVNASGFFTLVNAPTGTLTGGGATYTLGTVYNQTNFKLGSLVPTANTLNVGVTLVADLTTAYWTGGADVGNNVWAVSNGSQGSGSNWATTSGASAQGLVPDNHTSVIISSSSVSTSPASTVLGADMSIAGLTISDTTNGLGLGADGYKLTIGGGGINMSAGVPSSTIASLVALNTTQTWTNNSVNPLTVSGVISGSGSTNLTISGTGTVILTAANTYTAPTNISSGTLQLGDGVLNTGSVAGNSIIDNAALVIANPQALTYTGVISGNGTLTKSGAGTLTLKGTNTFTGSTNVSGGTVDLNSGLALENSTLVSGGISFDTLVASRAFTIGGLAGSGNITLSDTAYPANAVGLTIGNNNASTGYSGILSGSGSINKIGTGITTLSGLNSYSGVTNISAGALAVGATNSLSPNSAINVSGGILNASGFNNSIPSLIVGSGGTLVLGFNNLLTDIGSATLNGTLNLSGGTVTSSPDILMTYGSETGNFSTGVIGIPAGYTLSILPTALELVSSGPASLVWTNASGNNLWDTGSANWNNGSGTVAYSDTSNVALSAGDSVTFNDSNGGAGNYNVSIPATVHPSSVTVTTNAAYTFSGTGGIAGPGSLTLSGSGSLTLNEANSYAGGTNVSGGTLILGVAGALPTGTNLTIASGAEVFATNLSSVAFAVGTLNVAGKLDINNNALVVHNSSIGAVTTLVQSGFNSGAWNGSTGILSTAATNDSSHLTALGVIQNSVDGTTTGAVLHSMFENQTGLAATDVLVKYTYYGDANLDGAVDGSDYSRLDSTYLAEQTSGAVSGWFNGDFNYDGVVNGSDYTLIDNAFNSQGSVIAAQIASPTAQIASSGATSAVPEPMTLGLLGIGAIGLLGRRSRRRH